MSYTKYSPPIVTYSSIKLGNKISGTDILLQNTSSEVSSHTKVSFQPPYNKIYVTFSSNISLSYYEVRVTAAIANWDIGVGTCPWYRTNIASNTATEFEIDINSTYFNNNDGLYRVSFYAQSSIDGSWDVAYLIVGDDGFDFKPSDYDGFGITTIRDYPQQNN